MLMRFDPFREVDRLTQHLWGSGQGPVMPLDAYREDGQLVARFDLPGVEPDSIELTVEKNVLTVRAQRASERGEGQEWLVAERPQGSFSRQLFLGEGLDAEHIEAHYDHGVLTVTVAVAEAAKPRKVAITTGGQQAVEASSAAA